MVSLDNLKLLLNEQGRGSQEKLSKTTGISSGNISDWFNPNKKAFPNAESLCKIADYFDCSIDYIVGRSNAREIDINSNNIIYIEVFDQKVSAGKGDLVLDVSSEKRPFHKSFVPNNADYAVFVSGDSMEPDICSGQLIWVENVSNLSNGEIGVFQLNNEYFCKKLNQLVPNGDVRLISLNNKYNPIVVKESDDFLCRGRVLR